MPPQTGLTPVFEQNLLKNEISGNYRQMMQARSKVGELALEKLFEQRMNRGLDTYLDSIKAVQRQTLELYDGA